MRGQLAYMRDRGFDVVLISSPDEDLEVVAAQEGVPTVAVAMEREIHIVRDLVSLYRLCKALHTLKPDIVNASTPKAGLLGMVSAFLVRVPVRIYVLRGLRLETTQGLMRLALHIAERISCACAHRVICVSRSLRKAFVDQGLALMEKTEVLAAGSSNGVDAKHFMSIQGTAKQTRALRTQLGLRSEDLVIGFVGRFTRDKGIMELLDAFEHGWAGVPNIRLLLVGDFEDGDPIPDDYVRRIREHPGVVVSGFVPDTAPYYSLFHVLAFPSYREGFPNAPLEAAAAGVPVVGFRVTGTVDAVQDGTTGTLVPPGDVACLARALRMYLDDSDLRRRHGQAGRDRVARDFRQQDIWEAMYCEYLCLLHAKGL